MNRALTVGILASALLAASAAQADTLLVDRGLPAGLAGVQPCGQYSYNDSYPTSDWHTLSAMTGDDFTVPLTSHITDIRIWIIGTGGAAFGDMFDAVSLYLGQGAPQSFTGSGHQLAFASSVVTAAAVPGGFQGNNLYQLDFPVDIQTTAANQQLTIGILPSGKREPTTPPQYGNLSGIYDEERYIGMIASTPDSYAGADNKHYVFYYDWADAPAAGNTGKYVQVAGDMLSWNDPVNVMADLNVQVIGQRRLPGDANSDGKVDINDLNTVLANYDRSLSVSWTTGDFNGDGKVDLNDLNAVLANYDHSLGTPAVAAVPVPEPSLLALAMIGLGSLLAWRFII